MTEIQSAAADRRSREEIAEKDRRAKSDIADKDRRSKESIAKKDRIQKYVDTGVKGVTSAFGKGNLIGTAVKSLFNDKSWYNKDPQLVKDVAQISFQTPFGYVSGAEYNAQIMVLNYVPTLPHSELGDGNNKDKVDPVFVTAMKSLYAQIRKANSGARNYEYQDLIKYTLAIQSMYNLLSYFRRVYEICTTFNPKNNLFGQRLMDTLNIDRSMVNNLPRLRSIINYYSKMLETYSLPNNMTVVERQTWMNSNIFADHNLSKTQYYMYNMAGYYKIDDATSTTLKFVYFPHYLGRYYTARANSLTVDNVQAILTEVFDGLLSDPYAGVISGDIKKRFEHNNMLTFPELAENSTMSIGYSEEVLSQIENATILGHGRSDISGIFDITQNTEQGTVSQQIPFVQFYCAEGFTTNAESIMDNNCYVNMYLDAPTPDDVMVATRLTSGIEALKYADTALDINRTSIGTEMIINADIGYAYKAEGGALGYDVFNSFDMMFNTINGISNSQNYYSPAVTFQITALLAQFDWHPAFYVLYGTSGNIQVSTIHKEFKNYAVVSPSVCANMHRVAALSEYGLVDTVKA